MLKSQNRLKSRFEFNVTRKYGEHIKNPFFHLFNLKANNYIGPAKIGIVVSTKVHKNATKRNRIKRLFIENLRKQIGKFENNHWIVIQPTQECLEKTYEEIGSEITKTLSKISGSN